MSRLSASIICREAVRLLRNEISHPTKGAMMGIASFEWTSPREGLFYESVAIADYDLEKSLGDFSEQFIWPAMRKMAKQVGNKSIGAEFMELPKGVIDAVNERFDGVALRTVINNVPVRAEFKGWSRTISYYDLEDDAIKSGPCGIMVLFTAHEPGKEKYLTIPLVELFGAEVNQ